VLIICWHQDIFLTSVSFFLSCFLGCYPNLLLYFSFQVQTWICNSTVDYVHGYGYPANVHKLRTGQLWWCPCILPRINLYLSSREGTHSHSLFLSFQIFANFFVSNSVLKDQEFVASNLRFQKSPWEKLCIRMVCSNGLTVKLPAHKHFRNGLWTLVCNTMVVNVGDVWVPVCSRHGLTCEILSRFLRSFVTLDLSWHERAAYQLHVAAAQGYSQPANIYTHICGY